MTAALSGAWNFRDVAETAPVRPGLLFRSSDLSELDDDGRATVHRLGIGDVADLRSPSEVARRGPGQVPAEVTVHLLPFPDVAAVDGEAPHEATFQKMMRERAADEEIAAAARRYMLEEYQRFPTFGGARRAVRQVVTLLAQGRPVLTHCFAGKDRTGFTVATVLEAAGVDQQTIMADFLRSNAAVPVLRDRIGSALRSQAGRPPEVAAFAQARLTEEVLGVRPEYLDTARRTLAEQYGSVDGFLAAAGVTPAEVARLRAVLLG